MPDFLSKTFDADLPTGGDLPAGFTGLWMAVIRWVFMGQDNPADFPDEAGKPDSFRALGSWYRYYYKDRDVAVKSATALGQEYPPAQAWVYEAPIETIFLPDEVKDKFGAGITIEAKIRTLSSAKYRHEFQMISLPAAVNAYALMKGWVSDEYDLHEITDREVTVTDEFSAKLIGGEYYDLERESNITVPYTSASLWDRRTALWATLGESDPRMYLPTGEDRKLSTSADKLSEALRIVADWSSPIYARVAMVQDPRVDALSGNDRRLTVPALLRIFENEDEARAATGMDADGESSAPTSSRPDVPEQWKGAEDAWVNQVRDLKAKVGSVPVPVARAKLNAMEGIEGNIAATVEDALAWWGLV